MHPPVLTGPFCRQHSVRQALLTAGPAVPVLVRRTRPAHPSQHLWQPDLVPLQRVAYIVHRHQETVSTAQDPADQGSRVFPCPLLSFL